MIGSLLLLLVSGGHALAQPQSTANSRVEAVLANIVALQRPGQVGYATVWDGDKYVQCHRTPNGALGCEAAGSLMQPSLRGVLSPERLQRLSALGWRIDPGFGNFARTFPAKTPLSDVAGQILQALGQGYDADLAHLEMQTDWIAAEPCPPRNGPNQNLAGMVNDAESMAATAVYGCFYVPGPGSAPPAPVLSAADLIKIYSPRVVGEIQRLRINNQRDVFFVLDTAVGYIQCQPQTSPPATYCEAVSADSWPVLAGVLTPERVARLHAAGFADPGRAPNFSKAYPFDQFGDDAVARELLTILHDVYGFDGQSVITIKTEKGDG